MTTVLFRRRPWPGSLLATTLCLVATGAQAQSSACVNNEIPASIASTAVTTNNTALAWTAGATTRVFNVGTAPANLTATFTITPTIAFDPPYPQMDALSSNKTSLEVDHVSLLGNRLLSTLTIAFSRPVNKLRFVVQDLDSSNAVGGLYQDTVVINGDNGGTTNTPALAPASANVTVTGNSAAAIYPVACAANQATCNVTANYTGTVTSASAQYRSGTATGVLPTVLQAIAYDDFSFCIPVPDLQMSKATPAVVQGGTAAYTFIVSNATGLNPTAGTVTVRDMLPAGLAFPAGLTPTGANAANWSCVVSTTTTANDTADCTSTTAIVAAGTSTFTLTANVAATATGSLSNRAKVFGGGDPDKLALGTTGAITICSAANEFTAGGGATSGAGCAFEQTTVSQVSDLSVTKTDGVASRVSGSNTVYTIVYSNGGPSPAGGSIVADPASAGLNCASVTCAASGGAACPAGLSLAGYQAGVAIPTFPSGSTVTMTLTCNVTATGN